MSNLPIGTPSPDFLYIGAGMVYVDRWVDGKPTGNYRPTGNVPKFDIKTAIEEKTKRSSMEAARRVYGKAITSIDPSISTTLDEVDPHNLALALYGDAGFYTQTAQTGLKKTFTNVQPGALLNLGYKKVKNVVVKTATPNPGGSGTPVAAPVTLNTDYRLDDKHGRLRVMPGGLILDGDTVEVDFDIDVCKVPVVMGAQAGGIECSVIFAGDPTRGTKYDIEIWHAFLKPEGDVSMISEDWVSLGVTIDIIDDSKNHPDEPYYRIINID